MSLSGPEERGPSDAHNVSKDVDALFDFVCKVDAPSLAQKISFAASLGSLLSEMRHLDISAHILSLIKTETQELLGRIARSTLITKVLLDPPLTQEMWQVFFNDVEEILSLRVKEKHDSTQSKSSLKVLIGQLVSISVSQLDLELKISIKNRVDESTPSKLKPLMDDLEALEEMIVNRVHFLTVFEGIIKSGRVEVGSVDYMIGANNLLDLIFFGVNSNYQRYSGASLSASLEKLHTAVVATEAVKAYKVELLRSLSKINLTRPGLFAMHKEPAQFESPLNFSGISEELPLQEPIGFFFERIEQVLARGPDSPLLFARLLQSLPEYLIENRSFADLQRAAYSGEVLRGVSLIWQNASADKKCIENILELFRSDERAIYFSKMERRAIQELALTLAFQEEDLELRANIMTICRHL